MHSKYLFKIIVTKILFDYDITDFVAEGSHFSFSFSQLHFGTVIVWYYSYSRAIASSKIKSVTVADSAITISDKVKSLRVTLDQCLTFDSQVKATCKAIHYHVRSLHHIRRLLPDTCKVYSKLHRC